MSSKIVKRSWAEPYKMKMVELLKMTTKQQRVKAIKEAGFNTFLLKSEDVYIDLLTDSGTNAMSDGQWGSLMQGDEAYAGSKSYYKFEAAIQKHYGYKYIIPTHQGRGAENILSKILIKKGDVVPGNMYFTTTRLHQELAGGLFTDIIIDEAHDPLNLHPFKGNVDLAKLEKVVKKYGAKRIPYVSIATNVNMAGGQPISMANLKELRAYTKIQGIRIIHDMTRVAENAYFIQQREKGYDKKTVAQIVMEICSLTDGATMSAKKDALVNIGGFMATNEWDVYEEARNMVASRKTTDTIVHAIVPNTITYSGGLGKDKIHPTQKPTEILEYFIELLTKEGDTVLDTFAGSGSTGIAAQNTKRNAVLIERDLKMFNKMRERFVDRTDPAIAHPNLFE